MSLTPRATKGSPLTNAEGDAAFNGLDGRVTTAQTAATNAGTAAATAQSAATTAASTASSAQTTANAAAPQTRRVGGSALTADVPLKSIGGISVVGVGDIPIEGPGGITPITYSSVIPLDSVDGKDMGLHVLSGSDNFTIAGAPAPVNNGSCLVSVQLAGTFVPTFAAGISQQGDTFTAQDGRVYELGFVKRPAGPIVVITKTGFVNSSLPLPGVPTSLTAGSPTSTNIPLSWTAPAVDGSHGLPGTYQAQYRNHVGPGAWANYGSPVTHPTVTVDPGGLSASTSYDFQVKASNSSGDSAYSSILNNVSTTAPAAGSIVAVETQWPTAVNLTTDGFQDWVMDSGTSAFHRKGDTNGNAVPDLIGITAVNLTYPGWAHDGTLNVSNAGDSAIGPGAHTASAFGHDAVVAGDAKLQFSFPAVGTIRHAFLWFQPDGSDTQTLRLTISDGSAPEQPIAVPSVGTDTPRLYTIAYKSSGGGFLTASLETGSGLSTHSYFMFGSAAYKSS